MASAYVLHPLAIVMSFISELYDKCDMDPEDHGAQVSDERNGLETEEQRGNLSHLSDTDNGVYMQLNTNEWMQGQTERWKSGTRRMGI